GNSDMSPFQIDSLEGAQKIWDGTQSISPNYDGTISDNISLRDSVITTRPNLTTPMRNSSIHLHNYAGQNIYIENVVTSGADIGIYKDENSKWDNIHIENCIFDNEKKGICLNESSKTSEGLTIKDCVVKNIKEEGLIIEDYKNINVDGYTIKDASGNGIEIDNVFDCIIQNSNVKLTRGETAEVGIFVKSGENITIDKVSIEGATQDGIRVEGPVKHLTLNNISLRNLDTRGIRLRPLVEGEEGKYIKISNIDFPYDTSFSSTTTRAALGIYEGWEDVFLFNCNFITRLTGVQAALVVIRGANNVHIENSSFIGSIGLEGISPADISALRFQGNNDSVSITNCSFRNAHKGIDVFSGVPSSAVLLLANNHFKNCETGIYVDSNANAKVLYSGAFFANCDNDTVGEFATWNNS